MLAASLFLWVACLGLELYFGLLIVFGWFLLARVFGVPLFAVFKFDAVMLLLFPLFGVYVHGFLLVS